MRLHLEWLAVLILLLQITVVVSASAKKGKDKKGKKEKVRQESSEIFHSRSDQYKTQPGWQEPGLWRPKWIMDREFIDKEGEVTHKDRVYLKLKNDRTIKIFSQATRPRFVWTKISQKQKSKNKNLFETGNELHPDTAQQIKVLKEEQNALYDTDGAWLFADESPAKSGKVKIETTRHSSKKRTEDNDENGREEKEDEEDEMSARLLHEGRCDWGTLDGYAAKFRRGQILKYRGGTGGIPLGTYKVGSWTMRANVHRPLISKDFMAFQ